MKALYKGKEVKIERIEDKCYIVNINGNIKVFSPKGTEIKDLKEIEFEPSLQIL